MQDIIELLFGSLELTPQLLVSIGIGVGVLVMFYAAVSQFGSADEGTRRLSEVRKSGDDQFSIDRLSRRKGKRDALTRSFVPNDERAYSDVAKKLRRAGFKSDTAVRNFFMIRTLFGLVLPGLVGGGWLLANSLPQVASRLSFLPDVSQQHLLLILVGLIAVGFYGPGYVLKKRIEERQLRITEGFPNALDLLQISVEAGLGFDAAMNRVARELERSSPEIAEEFAFAQSEVGAGRDRERALLAMAERVGVTEVTAFVNVMLQSMQFGTSVSEALTTYAQDMRVRRELKAIEKANKLPVTMSATLVLFMLPALLTLVLSPIVINYIRIQPFGG